MAGTLLQSGQQNQQIRQGAGHDLTPNTGQVMYVLGLATGRRSWTAFPPEESFGKNNRMPCAISQPSSSSFPTHTCPGSIRFHTNHVKNGSCYHPDVEEGEYTFKRHEPLAASKGKEDAVQGTDRSILADFQDLPWALKCICLGVWKRHGGTRQTAGPQQANGCIKGRRTSFLS